MQRLPAGPEQRPAAVQRHQHDSRGKLFISTAGALHHGQSQGEPVAGKAGKNDSSQGSPSQHGRTLGTRVPHGQDQAKHREAVAEAGGKKKRQAGRSGRKETAARTRPSPTGAIEGKTAVQTAATLWMTTADTRPASPTSSSHGTSRATCT